MVTSWAGLDRRALILACRCLCEENPKLRASLYCGESSTPAFPKRTCRSTSAANRSRALAHLESAFHPLNHQTVLRPGRRPCSHHLVSSIVFCSLHDELRNFPEHAYSQPSISTNHCYATPSTNRFDIHPTIPAFCVLGSIRCVVRNACRK